MDLTIDQEQPPQAQPKISAHNDNDFFASSFTSSFTVTTQCSTPGTPTAHEDEYTKWIAHGAHEGGISVT
jgi:hypothetical protein